MMPRVNVDEPWLMERAYQIMHAGIPSQPMLGLRRAYLLQVGYGYLLAFWMTLFGVGLFQARLLGVVLGLAIVLVTAWIGRRLVDPTTGLGAALFLTLDSNFLGGVRNARTDIPSVFFATAALAAYLLGRQRSRKVWFVAAGASVGLAVLCHGNAFWVAFVLLAWCFLDNGFRVLTVSDGYAMLAGLLVTLGPYLAVILMRWREVQVQIGNFAADRVPGWRPWFILHQIMAEPQRYRGWYFGLVTSGVPNPLLWAFQLATVAGVATLVVHVLSRWRSMTNGRGSVTGASTGDPRGPARLLILVVGTVLIFAAFINNKVPVYLPHLLVGFSLAAGFGISDAASVASGWRSPQGHRSVAGLLALSCILAYGGAGAAYYEKWYAVTRKSELVPYEATSATLRTLVPAGPKYLYASPQFWVPFHAEPDTTFYSYTGPQPAALGPGLVGDQPIFLLVDEQQWLAELTTSASSSSSQNEWQQAWISFIERRCTLDGVAFGTAHGTMALYRCAVSSVPPIQTPRIVGGSTEYRVGQLVMSQTPSDLAKWPRHDDPRRDATGRPVIRPSEAGLEIAGTGWPGIVKLFAATPGNCYLVRTETRQTRAGDLLYLGTWMRQEVRSLAGASSAGIPASLAGVSWFPRDRAFRAVAPTVQLLVYSEASDTDFVISSLDIYRLLPIAVADRQRAAQR
jgi:4-amino-4-deoxy-L-arabinose transferase-like glycosyltransferase